MEKQKNWQFYLILAVLILTLYNILPTIFFYSKPLKAPIDKPKAELAAEGIVERVNALEVDSKEWLQSFTKLLGVKATSIALQKDNPGIFEVTFQNTQDAALFQRFLSKAGLLIPFVPSQLEVFAGSGQEGPEKVLVSRQIRLHLDPKDINSIFHYSAKYEENGSISPLYKEIVFDRATKLTEALAGPSHTGTQLSALLDTSTDSTQYDDVVISLAKEINDVESSFGGSGALIKRWNAQFAQANTEGQNDLVQKYIARTEALSKRLETQKTTLAQELKKQVDKGEIVDPAKEQSLETIDEYRASLAKALATLRKNSTQFKESPKPLSEDEIRASLEKGYAAMNPKDQRQEISLQGRNPFIQAIVIDWDSDKISTKLYSDVQAIRLDDKKTENAVYLKDKVNQYLINDIATVQSSVDEKISPDGDIFSLNLNSLTDAKSFLTLNLSYLADKLSEQLSNQLSTGWQPTHTDLVRQNYPIHSYAEHKKLPLEEQKLGLVVYAPVMDAKAPPAGFRTESLYVIAKGMGSILQKYKENPSSLENKTLAEDLTHLNNILQQYGFIGYPGNSYGLSPEFSKDFIFELDDYYSNLIKATREDFYVKGGRRNAILDFSDVEQRLIAVNKIEDRVQEDLLKWKEEYGSAQVDINATNKYMVPAPTKNVYWENFKLSFVKYFRGDDRKILKWGLDLSGGKTVRIGLRDSSNRPVKDPDDLKQAVNELYTRINKMGVSERKIRVENDSIILEFPGAQGLSATDLVKASAMYFHIVNEKFSAHNPTLKEAVQQFLQNVWNEAVVTNRKDVESINEIAWQHLGGDPASDSFNPRSDDAKVLYNSGLRLPNPKDKVVKHEFNDTTSSVAVLRGSDFSQWDGQTNPLIFVFHNYALEGSNLTNIQVGFDPSEGNTLTFNVKRSYEGSVAGNPRDDFYTWTSQFAEDRIQGTPKEAYNGGRGWRMAVILNGTVITSPALRAALSDGATISGRFSQREVNQLAADLKAGSLSFSPRILSEQNVSPELGKEERTRGIMAALVAVIIVFICMIGYYKFAGLVASCAVLFNILIMWGVLQNLDAAITLPCIAGIVLTIAMAIDANVLVFERYREEFKISGRVGSALQAGYRKAYSAIIDSNLTTILAALILIQFDSGPIKGFAVALIIGIISSMFTSLFVTRYFFAGWVQNPKNKELRMAQFVGNTNFDFLAQTKKAVIISAITIAFGAVLFYAQKNTMFGMDFTGGYSLNVELEEQHGQETSYRLRAMKALENHGASSNDVQVRELSKANQLLIQIGVGMEEKGKPFYQMPEELTEGKFTYDYEKNPRITWVVSSLTDAGLLVKPSELPNLDKNWTAMSGQLSDTMRNNALLALGVALLGILIYITVRFEFKYAVAAVIGLVHDVMITLGVMALLHKLGIAIQIDLQVVGAIMTIIGYSLNDTIIVFDRIREDVKILRKLSFHDIINHALNVTLSRTLMTSGTTVLVLSSLVIFGGHSIFSFSLVMLIGILIGTLSSLFIAGPMLLFLHNRDVRIRSLEHQTS